jgi:hypothetical protein
MILNEMVTDINVFSPRVQTWIFRHPELSSLIVIGDCKNPNSTYFGTFPGGRLLVFANKEQLNHLVKYGHRLVLMDACGSLGGCFWLP